MVWAFTPCRKGKKHTYVYYVIYGALNISGPKDFTVNTFSRLKWFTNIARCFGVGLLKGFEKLLLSKL